MKKLKKIMLVLGLASALALGGQVATADNHKAQAYTDGGWYFHYNCMPYPSGAFQWRDYNWWEETFLGKRDGYVWKYNFYNYC